MTLLYTSGDEGWLDSVYDRAWFEKVLATIDLRREDAVAVEVVDFERFLTGRLHTR